MKKENIYTTSFSDYLKEKNGKFVAFISSNQYAIEIEKDFSHEGMRNDLVKKTRPNIKLDNWGNAIDPNDDYRNDTIVLLGSPSEVWIEFPLKQMLNIEQYKCLCDILTNIDSYNKESSSKYAIHAYGFGMIEIEAKDYTNSIKELINRLTSYVEDSEYTVDDEVIIGREFLKSNNYNEELEKTLVKLKKEDILVDSTNSFKIKGYSNFILLVLITTIVSAIILILGMVIDLN